jgi:hypothetical protein
VIDMIGGSDLIVQTTLLPNEAYDVISQMVKEYWPNAVFESAEDEECPEDCFIYENERAKRLWSIDVPPESDDAHMIYMLFRFGYITFVYDRGTGSEIVAKKMAMRLGWAPKSGNADIDWSS